MNYNQVENETNYEGKALYNGNIAETYWRTGKDDVKRKYGYFYDDLNRLTNAVYQRPNSSGIGVVTNAYNESLTYDKNGNIITLQRNGNVEEIVPALEIDALDYVYKANSNELLKVTDNLETSPSGFNDRANNAEEYGYDLHGNMTRDDNKGITDIRYNHLNLPIKITFGTQGEIAYVYNAEGKKLEKTVTQTGSTAVTTKYLDGFQYVDNVLQFFPHAEGYVKKNGNNYNYVFNYTDHLGNVRLSYSDLDKDGVLEQDERILTVATDGSGNATEFFVSCIIEENNYYPFGLKHSGYNEGGFEASKYKVKYNGMEYQDELGLNFYDYGARNYDAALGKWMNIDPLAEVSRRWSPYTYGYNNPVRFTDPDGMLAMDQVGLSDSERDTFGMTDRSDAEGYGKAEEEDGSGNDSDPPKKITNKGKIKKTITYDNSSFGFALASSTFLLADDVTVVGVVDDIVIPFVWAGATAVWLYDNQVLIVKQAIEIKKLLEKNLKPSGFTYELRVNKTGDYIDVRGKAVHLKAGDVWKYGETTTGMTRYSDTTLKTMVPGGVTMKPIFFGNQVQIKVQEKIMIYWYALTNGSLPPGNKIFR